MLRAQTTRALGASSVAAAMVLTSLVPAGASAAATRGGSIYAAQPVPGALLLKKKKKRSSSGGGLQPEAAASKREAIRESAASAREAGNWGEVADTLEAGATELGDPVTMLEAGEARLTLADEERSIEAAQASIETTRKAIDILHFYRAVAAGEVTSRWRPIDPSNAGSLLSEAEGQIEAAETLIETIEEEQRASDEPEAVAEAGGNAKPAKAKKQRKRRERGEARPGTAMIGVGATFTALGAAGAGAGIAGLVISSQKQSEVEELDPIIDREAVRRLDDEGNQANLIGWIGLGVAGAALAIGIPLLAVGAKRRKKAGPANAAQVGVAPLLGGDQNGFVLHGRF